MSASYMNLLRERLPSFLLTHSPQLFPFPNALTNLAASSAFTRETMRAMPETHAPKNGRFISIFLFARAWLSNPRRLGAVAPSSNILAGLITAEIRPDSGPIIELGPGTGVFTRALLNRGVPENELALVEYNPDFVKRLGRQFTRSHIICLDASRLRNLELFGGESAGAVVSGLPLLSMSRRQVMAILSASFGRMRDDASFYQFTYSLLCPVPRTVLDRLGLQATRIGFTYANLPPASVYRIQRRRLGYFKRPNHPWGIKEHPEVKPGFSMEAAADDFGKGPNKSTNTRSYRCN